MFRYFRFGQFDLRITGNPSLLDSLPAWEQYISKSVQDEDSVITLNLEEAATLPRPSSEDGWRAETTGDIQQAVYIADQKVLFALLFTLGSRNVRILFPSNFLGSIRPGMQFGMLTALYQKCIGLHGVTLLCGDEIIILSAPSGTGKTTLAHLLEKYCDAIVINGDFAMLSLSDEGLVFEPTPFCGTSGRCLNHRLRVNRIVFLEQAKDTSWQNLSGINVLVKLLSNVYIPSWDSNLQNTIQENIFKLLPYVKFNNFAFAPDQKAAEIFYEMITHEQ